MLSAFRHFAGTWPARIFFLVLVASFATWGIADVVRNFVSGSSDAVATVQGHDITQQEFTAEFQTGLRRVAQRLPDPSQVPPQLRSQVARQTIQKMITQEALALQARELGVAAPDVSVRRAVYAMAEFQGPDGKFSEPMMLAALSGSNLTRAHFLELIRADIAQNQLLQSVAASAAPSELLVGRIYQYLNEKRRADLLSLPFANQTLPAAPPEAVLRRYYDNNPARYSSPEYRHIKAVILSPDSIGRSLAVPDADLHAWFDAHKADYVAPEKRSLQVITAGSAPVAARLAAQWRAGASWEAVQAAAKAEKATAVALDDATVQEVPSPELAKAAFAAAQGAVIGPLTEPFGSYVLRVASITPARNPTFESLKDTIRAKAAADKALDVIDARAQKLQDIFAGGAKIDEVPADLGATGAAGTLDAKGLTEAGEPAPIPTTADARQQIIDAAFKMAKGDPIQPAEGPDHIWYAVSVDSITPPARAPFEQVRARVLSDWQHEQIRHNQEAAATRILGLVKAGQPLAAAAWGSGLQVNRTAPLQRDRPAGAISAELAHALFDLKIGGATSVETNAGFLVAQVAEIIPADPKTDPIALSQAHDGLKSALHDDYLQLYATAVRDEAKPVIRPAVLQKLLAQPGE